MQHFSIILNLCVAFLKQSGIIASMEVNIMDINKDILSIAERIRNRRLELNLSYQALAERCGMNKSSLQRYETGAIGNVPLEKLKVLAEALYVSPAYLMGWEEPEIKTIAAHHDETEWSSEEINEIEKFKEFVKSKRNQK